MKIKSRYQRIIRDIMKEHDVSPISQPGHVVQKDAGFREALQYTDYYVGKGNDTQPNAKPHYRYHRYRELLNGLEPSGRRVAHVDIGCGAGLFSWTFLDWATAKGVDHDQVDLYGLDHSRVMIRLAQEIRTRLMPDMPEYPELHYSHKVKPLLRELKANHQQGTDYRITFGHVLAQVHDHDPADIKKFTRVILRILKLLDRQSNCFVVAVDAVNASIPFAEGWCSLITSLESANIRHKRHEVTRTSINDCSRARVVSLYPAE